ncbi:beta-propeller fold lactonase family protein [Amycolatopsis sp. NPDC051061]|uniref:beta-propeller fold lactonase family protein n=1 Tax=Amycolatopsis sp. NPDC051061 TaxID=3155042 RepID=UPI00341BD4BF
MGNTGARLARVHPNGRWVLVANEASSTVNVFRVDELSGELTDTGKYIAVPSGLPWTKQRNSPGDAQRDQRFRP